MELLEFIELLFFVIFIWVLYLIFFLVDYSFCICRRIGILNYTFLYLFSWC